MMILELPLLLTKTFPLPLNSAANKKAVLPKVYLLWETPLSQCLSDKSLQCTGL